jgi:hypothetical protein
VVDDQLVAAVVCFTIAAEEDGVRFADLGQPGGGGIGAGRFAEEGRQDTVGAFKALVWCVPDR